MNKIAGAGILPYDVVRGSVAEHSLNKDVVGKRIIGSPRPSAGEGLGERGYSITKFQIHNLPLIYCPEEATEISPLHLEDFL